MLPNFLIIGAQKSATTFVHHCLSEHPSVFMPLEEIPFFEDPDYSQSNLESLEKLFEGASRQKTVGIKRPNYLHKPECPERIYKHVPSARLIAILRDPLERAISAYYHYARMGFAPIRHVNEGLLEILNNGPAKQYPRSAEIIEFGFYHKHLSRYLNYFDNKQMLIMLYDDIMKDSLDSLKKVFKFLEIDEEYVPQSLNSRPQSGVYSIPRLRLRTLRNPIVYTYSSDQMRLFPKEEIGLLGSTIAKVINRIDSRVLSRVFSNARPSLSRDLTEALSAIYKEDTSKLEELLGLSLAHWKVFYASD
ncbi:MAG: sulfotransferase domain-containing protein [Anaerolineae bacterium]